MPASALVGLALAGLVLGRVLRPLAERLLGTAPVVSWTQPTALVVVAVVLAIAARATRRQVREARAALPAYRAVNRLLLARASALTGALVGGGYAGYALAWWGSPATLADQRVLRSGACVAAAVLVVVAALLLERACRVPPDEPEP